MAEHRQARYNRLPAIAVGAVAVIATASLGGIALDPSLLPTSTIAGTAYASSAARSSAAQVPAAPEPAAPARTARPAPSSETSGTTRRATTAEEVGVVDITTALNYGEGAAAGTGVVLTPTGEILTNNHVVEGATRIRVTVPATGTSYTASVVGTDPTDDVAVLRLSGASGLATAHLGTVVALGRDITASDETGADPERLTGLIEVNAAVQAGDSGGPLYSDGVVIGIDTAASEANSRGLDTTAATNRSAGFAIPITTATSIADRIVQGEDSSTVHQGEPAFLGVQMLGTRNRDDDGATISGVVGGSPAATAGLQAGDTITAIDGTAVDSTPALSEALANHHPHDRITVSWTDTAGTSHTATVTLIAGPAD